MENSFYYNTSSINFIKILFRIFVVFFVVSVILIFTLNVNDTVEFREGLIYSNTPQLKINAPNEVKILKVFVKEGQEVKKGDTIFILENKRTQSDFDIANMDVEGMTNKIVIVKGLIKNAQERKNAINQLLEIQSKIYTTDRKKAEQEIATINNKINLSSEQSSIMSDKYKVDSLLYAKGAISRYELSETKNRNIDDKKGQVDNKFIHTSKNYDFENLSNNYQKTNNDLRRSIIEINSQIKSFEREILELKTLIKDKKYNLTYIIDELGKLIVSSPMDGTVSNVFNAKQNLEIIGKGELLVIIAPKKETFYSKILLKDTDLTYIEKGQTINLKLDAYNYYKFGAIKGKINYISPSDVDSTFYCLASIEKYNHNILLKAGYKLKGEVIIEKMKLYEYILKKLFNKIDNCVN